MGGVSATLNMAELIEITNEVNEKVCKAIGEEALAEAKALAGEFAVTGNYRDTLRLEVLPRESVEGNHSWAHTRVVSGARYGHLVEAKHGTLARALGASE